MDIQRTSSRQITVNVMDGNNQVAAMFASFRPGKSLNVNLEIVNDDYVEHAESHHDEIAAAFDAFIADALTQAHACGVPVNAPPEQRLAYADNGSGDSGDEPTLAPAT